MATAKQISQEIIDWNNVEYPEQSTEYFESAWSEFLEALKEWESDPPEVPLPSGPAKFLKKFGGEGKGEEYWVIFKVGDELFKVDGYYASWDGISWDDAEIYKVAPVEVTIIEYQRIKE